MTFDVAIWYTYLFIYLFIYLLTYLLTYLLIYLFIYLFIIRLIGNALYVIHRMKNLICGNSHESVVKCPVVKFEFQQSLKSC